MTESRTVQSRFRAAALTATVVGATGSIALLLRAAQHPPRLLLLIFSAWVLFPFGVCALVDAGSCRWSAPTRGVLHALMLIVATVTLVIYAYAGFGPPRQRPTPYFVLVPPISTLLIAGVAAAGWLSRGRDRT